MAVLTILKVSDVIEKNFMCVSPDMDLGQLTSVVAKTKRNIFPVVNAANRLVGIIYLDDIRHMMFRQELYHRYSVATLMREVTERVLVVKLVTQVCPLALSCSQNATLVIASLVRHE